MSDHKPFVQQLVISNIRQARTEADVDALVRLKACQMVLGDVAARNNRSSRLQRLHRTLAHEFFNLASSSAKPEVIAIASTEMQVSTILGSARICKTWGF